MQYNILDDFSDFENGRKLCILPIPRLITENKIKYNGTVIYPADSLDFSKIRLVSTPEYEWQEIERRGHDDSEWFKSAITQVSLNDWKGHALVAFYMDIDWKRFLTGAHEYHKSLILEASEIAESTLDIVRLKFCNLQYPEKLPGKAGTLTPEKGIFATAIFFSNNADCESYMTAGQVFTHYISIGLGLELTGNSLPPIKNGEVGHIARQALKLQTLAMENNTNSGKFVSAMSVLDFLANPNKYEKGETIRETIALHIAKDTEQYCEISEKLKSFLGGTEPKIRTQIVHEGKRLEEILQNNEEIKEVFTILDHYIGFIIEDLINHSDKEWEYVESIRKDKKERLGINKNSCPSTA